MKKDTKTSGAPVATTEAPPPAPAAKAAEPKAEVVITPPPALEPWQQRISAFAKAVGKPEGDITKALAPLVGEPGKDALEALSDPQAVLDTDLVDALVKDGPKIPVGIFRKNAAKLRGDSTIVIPASSEAKSGALSSVLPMVPEDVSFLEMLKVGGVLKPGQTEVISALRAALAYRFGLYDLPDTIVARMEAFAESQEEAVGETFFKLRNIITSRSYGDILSVLGVPGSFVTEGRRKAFLEKLDTGLWSELRSFNSRLVAWQDTWLKGVANPGMAFTMMAMSQSGRPGVMPPGMMQPPETASLRDAAEGVINQINKVFAGFGVPVARALAYDATRIKGVLEDPALPAAIGATNREQMVKMLGASVTADNIRMERSITRFTLAIMELPKVSSGNDEYAYLAAMLELSNSIPWDKLPASNDGRAGLGRTGYRNGGGRSVLRGEEETN